MNTQHDSAGTTGTDPVYDVVVVGGGPAGATAAHELALLGRSVVLLDRAGRTKPCGGAVPPQLLKDFDVPESMLVAHIDTARIISPEVPQGRHPRRRRVRGHGRSRRVRRMAAPARGQPRR